MNRPIIRPFIRATLDLSDEPTITAPVLGSPYLPRDGEGRPYLSIVQNDQQTLPLVEMAVDQYKQIEGRLPRIIYLSPIRFLEVVYACGLRAYDAPDLHIMIPYDYNAQLGLQYDVLCQG